MRTIRSILFDYCPLLGFNDNKIRLIGIPLAGLLIPIVFFGRNFNDEFYWANTVFSTIYTVLYWQICRFFFIIGNERFPNYKDNSRRLTWILLACFSSIFLLCNVTHHFLEPLFLSKDSFAYGCKPSIIQVNAASFTTFLLVAGLYESMRNFNLWKTTTIEKEQLVRANMQSQLESLRNQVNPHFLFNSLNTLVNIIPEQPDTAVRFVQKLSKVYRYILEMRDTNTTPLSTELEFLNAYIFLLKERFGENLIVNINIPIEDKSISERQIVPLALQILFENAIKHNIISAAKPLHIEVFVEKNGEVLIVKNNLQRKNQMQEGTGVGLENVKNRYKLVSNKEVEVIVSANSFIVSLPLLLVG